MKIYSTKTNPSFDTTRLFGSAANLSSPITGIDTLIGGMDTNYFWVTYDVPPNAMGGDTLDAECTSITMSGAGGTRTPMITSPAGNRIIVSSTNGVSEKEALELGEFNVYPNPTEGQFILSMDLKSSEDIKMNITNILGVKVYERKEVNISSMKQEVDLGNYTKGMYYVIVESTNSRIMKKVFVR